MQHQTHCVRCASLVILLLSIVVAGAVPARHVLQTSSDDHSHDHADSAVQHTCEWHGFGNSEFGHCDMNLVAISQIAASPTTNQGRCALGVDLVAPQQTRMLSGISCNTISLHTL